MSAPPYAPISRETEARLRQYQTLLHKWQDKINLISPSTLPDSWARHFEDSLQLLPLIDAGVKAVYDLGSGAGFPGLVIAMARPDLAVTLIESDAKKCAFLQTVSRETGTAVTVSNARIESVARSLPAPDLVTARALASLEALFAYVWPWANAHPPLALLFPKGERWREEIEAARAGGWDFETRDFGSRTDERARLLLFTSLRKTPV